MSAAATKAKLAEQKAKRAADKEAREAARADRTAARQQRAEDREANKLKDDATPAELVDIMTSATAPAQLKMRAVSKFSLDNSLYTRNSTLVHERLGEILDNGGQNINGLLMQIGTEHATVLAPYVTKLIERVSGPKAGGRTSTGAPTALMILQQVASAAPDKVFPHISAIITACEALPSTYRGVLIKVIGRASRAKTPKDAADQMFLQLMKMLKEPNVTNEVASACLVEISDMRERVSNSGWSSSSKVLLNNMPTIAKFKDANLAVFTAIDDFAHGRSMKTVNARLDGQDARLAMHEKWLKQHDEQLTSLADQFELSRDEMRAMTEKINKISHGNEEQTSKMLSMIEGITAVMQQGKQSGMAMGGSGEDGDEFEQLLDRDMYARALYNTVRSELTATYLASKSVQTDIVANSKSGTAGDVGNVLQTASSYIPVIGAGVMFLGAVLSIVDANTQATMVQRFANLAVDTEDMNKISRAVARELVLCIDREKVNRPESLAEKCKNWIKFGVGVVSGNMDGDAGSAIGELAAIGSNAAMGAAQDSTAEAVQSFDFKSMFSRSKKSKAAPSAAEIAEAEAVEQGEADAGIVANAIISAVYSGKAPGKHRSVTDKISFLSQFVRSEFGRGTTPAAAAGAVAAAAVSAGVSVSVNPLDVEGDAAAKESVAAAAGRTSAAGAGGNIAKAGCCIVS